MGHLSRERTTVGIEPQHASKCVICTVRSFISDSYNNNKPFKIVGVWLPQSTKMADTNLARKCDLANYAVPVTERHRQHRSPRVA